MEGNKGFVSGDIIQALNNEVQSVGEFFDITDGYFKLEWLFREFAGNEICEGIGYFSKALTGIGCIDVVSCNTNVIVFDGNEFPGNYYFEFGLALDK